MSTHTGDEEPGSTSLFKPQKTENNEETLKTMGLFRSQSGLKTPVQRPAPSKTGAADKKSTRELASPTGPPARSIPLHTKYRHRKLFSLYPG